MKQSPSPGGEIRILNPDDVMDFAALIRVFADAFEMPDDYAPPGEDYLQHLLEKPHFLAMVARVDGKVVGGLTAYVLDQYYREQPQAYLYDIAVGHTHQRQGIGKELLSAFNEYCAKQGYEEVFVQADADDEYALDFYRATGASREAAVVHFSYDVKIA